MADIKVYGTLHAQTGDGVVARAAQLYDTALGAFQSELNQQFSSGGVTFDVSNEILFITTHGANS